LARRSFGAVIAVNDFAMRAARLCSEPPTLRHVDSNISRRGSPNTRPALRRISKKARSPGAQNMKRSKSAKQKKRGPGRPATGVRPMIGLRLSDNEIARLDRWAKAQGHPDRSSAIRALIESGLATAQARRSRRATAADMAGQAIDRLADPAAPPKDRAKRKRRLLKGPEEFRDLRGDKPTSRRPKESNN